MKSQRIKHHFSIKPYHVTLFALPEPERDQGHRRTPAQSAPGGIRTAAQERTHGHMMLYLLRAIHAL